jgi:hypothetical protein
MKQDNNLRAFAISLKNEMRSKQIDIEDLAFKADLSVSFVYRLIQRTRRPSRDIVIILGIKLGLTIDKINEWLEFTGHRQIKKKKVPITQKKIETNGSKWLENVQSI